MMIVYKYIEIIIKHLSFTVHLVQVFRNSNTYRYIYTYVHIHSTIENVYTTTVELNKSEGFMTRAILCLCSSGGQRWSHGNNRRLIGSGPQSSPSSFEESFNSILSISISHTHIHLSSNIGIRVQDMVTVEL